MFRVDRETHEELEKPAPDLGTTVGEAVAIAARRLRQQLLGNDLNAPLTEDETNWLDDDANPCGVLPHEGTASRPCRVNPSRYCGSTLHHSPQSVCDNTRNGSKKWCMMNPAGPQSRGCGNIAKARRQPCPGSIRRMTLPW